MKFARATLALSAFAIAFAHTAAGAQDWRPLKRAQERHSKGVDPKKRVLGGAVATLQDNPWQVALLNAKDPNRERAHFCGGAVVSRTWVVTAAHCVDDAASKNDVHVLANTNRIATGGDRLTLERIVIHKAWNRPTRDSDIALLKVKLAQGQSLGTPLALEKSGKYPPGTLARISGWGATQSSATGTDLLQAAETRVVSAAICGRPEAYGSALTANMLCIGEKGKDSCGGDSGGPATAVVDGKRQLIGVTSFGFVTKCVAQDKPGIYTRAAAFAKWVGDTAKD